MKRMVLTGFLILSAVSAESRAATGDAALSNYEMAFGLTRAGSFGLAETAWRNFLTQYPDHPLAGNAQYFLGETFYGRNDYARAAIAYGIGVERYPQSDVAPQTLLKLGIALGRAGETGHACDALARLDRQFPRVSGVVKERALVERRQYQCAESEPAAAEASEPVAEDPVKLASAAVSAGENATPPSAASAPIAAPPPVLAPRPRGAAAAKMAAIAPTPPGGSVPDRSAMADKSADADPAPPAQPVTPVDRKPLVDLDAERAAARAELYVTPPPVVPPRRVASREAPHAAAAATASPESIRTAQTLLAALDYDPGPVDGQPGVKLRDAVRSFEKRNDMRQDGEVSDKLLQRLSAAVLSVSRKAAPPAASAVAAPPGVLAVHRTAGTGFIVSKSGFVITSYHLVAACKEIQVRSIASESDAVSVVASDSRNDLALLRLKTAPGVAVSFRDGRGPRHGEGIVVTGLSLGEEGSSDFYLTTGVVNALSGGRDDNGVMKVSAPISTETGGAPVFDTTGHVIGILGEGAAGKPGTDAAQRAGMALRATIARNFLDAHNVDYDSATAAGELKAAEIGDAAKEVVVLVECRK
jgi:tol-pal system protein YbgF